MPYPLGPWLLQVQLWWTGLSTAGLTCVASVIKCMHPASAPWPCARPRGLHTLCTSTAGKKILWGYFHPGEAVRPMVIRNQEIRVLAPQLPAEQFWGLHSLLRRSLWNRAPVADRSKLNDAPLCRLFLLPTSFFPLIAAPVNRLHPSPSLRRCFPGTAGPDVLPHAVPSRQLRVRCATASTPRTVSTQHPLRTGTTAIPSQGLTGRYRQCVTPSMDERTRYV